MAATRPDITATGIIQVSDAASATMVVLAAELSDSDIPTTVEPIKSSRRTARPLKFYKIIIINFV